MRYLTLLLVLLSASLMAQSPYARIDALVEQGKYRSARELADAAYATATRPDARARLLDYRVRLTRELEEDGQQAAVDLLRAALRADTTGPVLPPVANLLLAEAYQAYAQRNGYRLSRLTTAGESGVADTLPLADYDLRGLLYLARRHAYRALELTQAQRTPLAELPDLIAGGGARIEDVPTLYDLVAQRALEVLGSDLGTLTDDRLASDSLALLPAEAFAALDLALHFDLSQGTPRKLGLYQQWIAYHLDAGGPALLYADLERMRFVHRAGVADSTYLAALDRMYANYPGVVSRDRILVAMAGVLDRDDEQLGAAPRVRALELLDRVGEGDPVARMQAAELRAAITRPGLDLQTESFYPLRNHLLVSLDYRNVERVYYRIYPYDPTAATPRTYRPAERLAAATRGKPVASGSHRLAPNDDYTSHRTELDLDPLPAGAYRVVLSDDASFTAESSNFAIASFQVTDLALVEVSDAAGGYIQLVDRTTGAAVTDATVSIRREENRGAYAPARDRTVDARGAFTLPEVQRFANFQVTVTRGRDRLVAQLYNYDRRPGQRQESRYTTLLTDRPLYRPGQTVHVYGLRYRTDTDELPAIVAEAAVTVTLRDANYQEVASREVTTDAYGRFSLDFTLPDGGLTGDFSIQTEDGNAGFRVEAYKRPRFEVTLEAPDAAGPGTVVTVDGSALTYAGPPVAEGQVNYRVYLEEVRWFYYRSFGGGGDARQLLASGSTETDDAGDFRLSFPARSDLDRSGFRRYRYVVEADVTDPTGESHQAAATVGIRGQRPAVAVTPGRESVDRGDTLSLLAATDDAGERLSLTLRIVPVEKPDAALLERAWPVPDRPVINRAAFARNFPYLAYAKTPELTAWPATGDAVYEAELTVTGGEARLSVPADFPVGHYRVEVTDADGSAGPPATFSVFDAAAAELPAGMLYALTGAPDTVRVGEPLELQLVSAVDLPLVLYRWQSRTTDRTERAGGGRRFTFTHTPTEADRGGLAFTLAAVRLNRTLTDLRQLAFPWDNQRLTATYATFRDRLRPGAPEEWTVTLRNADGIPVAAAALATMYDASLDQLFPGAPWEFSPFPGFYGGGELFGRSTFGAGGGETYLADRPATTDTLAQLPVLLLHQAAMGGMRGKAMAVSARSSVQRAEYSDVAEEAMPELQMADAAGAVPPPPPPPAEASATEGDAPVGLRTNLQETAFWLPELTAGTDGSLRISFTSPEALTAWKFRLFAHDKALRYVISEREVVTQKELMVLPNVPRFLRVGDSLALTARVSNLTDRALQATVSLELFDPASGEEIRLGAPIASGAGAAFTREAGLAANASATVRFALRVPADWAERGLLGYRVLARAGDFSDGEENVVPVLTDRALVTVSRPFFLRPGARGSVTLPGLADDASPTREQVGYVFEATTDPVWLALKALPYLMEYPYDCTEQLVNRYFANQLAYATVSTKPVLEAVFRKWQADSTALLGELERNAALTDALLTETPWVREARSESEQRARIARLFDLKQLAEEQRSALDKLAARQGTAGDYGWFPGGPANRYMTQYVVEVLARMRQLEVITPEQAATVDRITGRAVAFLDAELEDDYRLLFAAAKDSVEFRQSYRPTALQLHYLYARTLSGISTDGDTKALTFFRQAAYDHWTDYGLYEQALLAIAAGTSGSPVAEAIVTSLRERALQSEEFGMYWKYDRGFHWNELPVETHTRLMEAFRAVDPRPDELNEMRLWLLSNKRTNHWETTKSTAAAVFAIVSGGTRLTTASAPVLEARWPGTSGKNPGTRVRAQQESAEAATGTFELRLPATEVTPDLATVNLRNRGDDIVWGGVYWQYTDEARMVEADGDGPLRLERAFFRRSGDQLTSLTEGEVLHPGERVTVRLSVTTDRDMDYVHVKDRRAATFEPVNALSGYTFSGGLGYYYAPGDLATNFFIDHLPRGTYVLEYDLFTTYAGTFSNGLGRVECMYAPEFGGNTAGGEVLVR